MTPGLTLAIQLVILAVTAVLAVLSSLSARRAASFDITRDFDQLASAVAKLQQLARSAQMAKVRQGAGTAAEQVAPTVSHATTPMSHEQLRALLRSRNGATQ